LDNGGNDGRNSSPTVGVRFWHLGTLLADGNSPVFCLAQSCNHRLIEQGWTCATTMC
jgi:hypothetical protein